ncbi:MAG: ATP-binding cassette domain-containing protein [Bacteroidetes bacterium]|nr:MAG: ATP-binding cassette domain-containing protein [Bacteroidota bacterium]
MLVQLENVTVKHDRHVILKEISFTVEAGEFVNVVGESGAGKSSLLRLLYMDLKPDTGTVAVGEYTSHSITPSEVPYLRRKLGIIFQDFKLLEDRSVYDNVAFALHVTGATSGEIRKKVVTVLTQVGLSHKRNAMPHQLSGGEQQRVCIARALVNEPFLILADEPTGNLDPGTSLDILKLLLEINHKGTAVLMTTHNYDLVRKAGGRILQIKERQIREVQLKQ